jgi:hypothetical protein
MLELIQQLVAGIGINQQQAEGGVGLLMGLVKDKLSTGDFAQVAEAVPGLEGLIDAAPQAGGLGGLLGGVVSALGGTEVGNLASLASGFSKLDLDAGTVGQFIPILLSFLQSQGGKDLAAMVGRALQGD